MPAGVLKETVVTKPHAGGIAGAFMSLDEVAKRAWAVRSDPRLRAWSLKQIAAAGNPSSIRGRVQAIVNGWRRAVPYVPDPPKVELMASPVQVLCLDDHGLCIRGGDCDEFAIGCMGAAMSVGIEPCYAVGASYDKANAAQPSHVYFAFTDEKGSLIFVDPTTSMPVGQVSPTVRTWVIDPQQVLGISDLPGGDFVGIAGPSHAMRPSSEWGDLRLSGREIQGIGLTTPGDVLSYRAMWDEYVMGTARALQACSEAYAAAAAGQPPGTTLGSATSSASVMQTISSTNAGFSSSIVASWNAYAGWSASQILFQSAAILESFQKTVLSVGQTYRPSLAQDCPALASVLTDGPDLSTQAQIISGIEGAGLLAAGVLQVLGIGLNGAFQTLGDAASFVGKKVGQAVNLVTSPVTWVVIGLVAVAGATVYVVSKMPSRRAEPYR